MSSDGVAGAWSYRTGPWFAAFGPRVTVLLPESQRGHVIGVWSLVDGGAAFDEVLDALLASGLSKLPAFVLVSSDDGPTRVLLRGADVSATLTTDGDDVVLDGSASGTWVERSVEGVTSLSVTLAGGEGSDAGGQDFGVVTGLVRVSRIDRPPYVEPAAAPETEEVPEATPVAEEVPATDEVTPLEEPAALEEPAPLEAPAPLEEPAPFDELAPLDEPAPLEAPAPLEEPAPFDEPTPLEPPAALDEPATNEPANDEPTTDEQPITPVRPEVEVALPPVGDPLTDPMPPAPAPSDWVTPWDTPPPAPAASDDADEGQATEVMDLSEVGPMTDEAPAPAPTEPPEPMTDFAPPPFPPPPAPDAPPVDLPPPPPLTVGSWEPIGGPVPPPTPPAPTPPASAAAETGAAPTDAVAKLMFSDGQQMLVDRVILIGRAPEARRFDATEQPALVTVPSRLHEISSTHIEVRPGTGAEAGSAIVTDMGSTNGTVLVQPGLQPEDLKPGIAVALQPGAIINLGDGVTIQVTRA